MTILAPHTASRVRNAALSALHFIAYENQCEVPDILALLTGQIQSVSGPDTVILTNLGTAPDPTPSQPPSQAPAARMSDQPSSDTQAEVSAPQTSATEPQPSSTPAVQARPVDPSSRSLDGLPTSLPGADGAVDRATETGKSGEAPASPAPVKRTRTKGRGKVVEASIRGNPDWTDLMHAEHLGVDPAYIRRTAVRLGLKLASRLSHRKAKQAATTEVLKATAIPKPAKPMKAPPAAKPRASKTLKERVAEVHAEHPEWSAKQIAAHLGGSQGAVSAYLFDARADEREAEERATQERLIAEARERDAQRQAMVPVKDGRTLTERVRAMHQQHPTWTARLIANELGANPNSVSALLAGIRNPKAAPKVEKPEFTGRRQMIEHYGEIAKRLGKSS